MKITKTQLKQIISEEFEAVILEAHGLSKEDEGEELEERCQKGYKTHPTRKTKKMFRKNMSKIISLFI